MGKKQHQKDKLYLTTTEWSTLYGGKKAKLEESKRAEFRRLPFHSCSLSFQPFEHPYCTKEGTTFDLLSIVPFLKKYGLNPVNGEKLNAKELIKLNYHKNGKGQYHCPVTFKIFNANTHIVAVKTTGNVFAYEAIERLNIKPNYWKDLITDEPFVRKDLIHLQDPTNLDKFNFANFYHLKKNLKVLDEDEEQAKKDPQYRLKTINTETRDILNELGTSYKAPEKEEKEKKLADAINAAHYSMGTVSASFTSTSAEPATHQEAAIIDESLLRYERVKKKAYVRIITNKGQLNVELHSDHVPRTCENFLKHCISGYYKGTIFHRSMRNFMIQGGDPEGTGLGGQSIWGKPFNDEFKPNLTHSGRGVLSMANSGPNTNKSQFFITYRSARHLDNKHAVFGRIVGGLDTLNKMEKVETKKGDKPKKEIKILDTQVFVNPYDEADEQLLKEREEAIKRAEAEKEAMKRKVKVVDSQGKKVFKAGIGKYINPAAQKRTIIDEEAESKEAKKKRQAKSEMSDFSSW